MARFNPVVKLKRLKPQDSILTPYSRVVQPQKAIVKPQMLSHVIDSYVVPENIDQNKHSVKLSNEQKMARFNPVVKLKHLKPQDSILTPYSRVVQPQKAVVKPQMLSHVIDSYVMQEVTLKSVVDSSPIDVSESSNSEDNSESIPDDTVPEREEHLPVIKVSLRRGCTRGKIKQINAPSRRSLRQKSQVSYIDIDEDDLDVAEEEDNRFRFAKRRALPLRWAEARNKHAKKKSSRRKSRYWTAEELKQLDMLLRKFPPKGIESQRWKKIANCLKNRTQGAVGRKLQTYYFELLKAGMPIPGRMPTKYRRKFDDENYYLEYYVGDEDEDEKEEDDEDEEEEDDEDIDEEEEEDDENYNQWLLDEENYVETKEKEDEEEEDDDENYNQCLVK